VKKSVLRLFRCSYDIYMCVCPFFTTFSSTHTITQSLARSPLFPPPVTMETQEVFQVPQWLGNAETSPRSVCSHSHLYFSSSQPLHPLLLLTVISFILLVIFPFSLYSPLLCLFVYLDFSVLFFCIIFFFLLWFALHSECLVFLLHNLQTSKYELFYLFLSG